MKRMKRWNCDVTKLPAAYLNNVIEKMLAYGESVQFSASGSVDGPNYQVINAAGKKISFDSGNLLIHADEKEFVGKNSAIIYTLEQIKAELVRINSPAAKAPAKARRVAGTGSPRGGSAVAKAKEQIAIQKYEYYKTNRATLPSDIREHSEEITRMMESGMSAELAFTEAIKLCFEHT
jgi:hypothetical protein